MKFSVSIIVPFYNVEECVSYCMDSLLTQTYGDYEIICVDDGSTDKTGELLDSYASIDIVNIYHKPNGGLSDARNFGIRVARGEYITFVDGDDVVSPYYLEHMMNALRLKPGALIVGSFRKVAVSSACMRSETWEERIGTARVLSQAECVDEFLRNTITESAWGKLAPRSVYNDNFFPVGRLYEDLAVFPSLITQFEWVVCLDSEDYGYVIRAGSIARANRTSIKQAQDYFNALESLNDLPVNKERLAYRRSLAVMRMRPILKAAADEPNEAKSLMKAGLVELRKNLAKCIGDGKLSVASKGRLFLYAVSPTIHDALLGLFQRKSGGDA